MWEAFVACSMARDGDNCELCGTMLVMCHVGYTGSLRQLYVIVCMDHVNVNQTGSLGILGMCTCMSTNEHGQSDVLRFGLRMTGRLSWHSSDEYANRIPHL